MRGICVLGALLLTVACGGGGSSSPTSPSGTSSTTSAGGGSNTPSPTPTPAPTGPANIGGNWTGTAELQISGVRYFSNISMTLTQGSGSARGTWVFTSAGWDMQGEVSGNLSGSGNSTLFSGTATIVGEPRSNTGKCHGTVVMSGTSTATSMRWTGPDVRLTDCVNNVGGFVWIFNR